MYAACVWSCLVNMDRPHNKRKAFSRCTRQKKKMMVLAQEEACKPEVFEEVPATNQSVDAKATDVSSADSNVSFLSSSKIENTEERQIVAVFNSENVKLEKKKYNCEGSPKNCGSALPGDSSQNLCESPMDGIIENIVKGKNDILVSPGAFHHLSAMGVRIEDSEKLVENVSVGSYTSDVSAYDPKCPLVEEGLRSSEDHLMDSVPFTVVEVTSDDLFKDGQVSPNVKGITFDQPCHQSDNQKVESSEFGGSIDLDMCSRHKNDCELPVCSENHNKGITNVLSSPDKSLCFVAPDMNDTLLFTKFKTINAEVTSTSPAKVTSSMPDTVTSISQGKVTNTSSDNDCINVTSFSVNTESSEHPGHTNEPECIGVKHRAARKSIGAVIDLPLVDNVISRCHDKIVNTNDVEGGSSHISGDGGNLWIEFSGKNINDNDHELRSKMTISSKRKGKQNQLEDPEAPSTLEMSSNQLNDGVYSDSLENVCVDDASLVSKPNITTNLPCKSDEVSKDSLAETEITIDGCSSSRHLAEKSEYSVNKCNLWVSPVKEKSSLYTECEDSQNFTEKQNGENCCKTSQTKHSDLISITDNGGSDAEGTIDHYQGFSAYASCEVLDEKLILEKQLTQKEYVINELREGRHKSEEVIRRLQADLKLEKENCASAQKNIGDILGTKNQEIEFLKKSLENFKKKINHWKEEHSRMLNEIDTSCKQRIENTFKENETLRSQLKKFEDSRTLLQLELNLHSQQLPDIDFSVGDASGFEQEIRVIRILNSKLLIEMQQNESVKNALIEQKRRSCLLEQTVHTLEENMVHLQRKIKENDRRQSSVRIENTRFWTEKVEVLSREKVSLLEHLSDLKKGRALLQKQLGLELPVPENTDFSSEINSFLILKSKLQNEKQKYEKLKGFLKEEKEKRNMAEQSLLQIKLKKESSVSVGTQSDDQYIESSSHVSDIKLVNNLENQSTLTKQLEKKLAKERQKKESLLLCLKKEHINSMKDLELQLSIYSTYSDYYREKIVRLEDIIKKQYL